MTISTQRNGIVWDKSINLGNVLTIITMITLGFLTVGKLDTRITVLEAAEILREKAASVETTNQNNQRAEVRQDLREIRQELKGLADAVRSAK